MKMNHFKVTTRGVQLEKRFKSKFKRKVLKQWNFTKEIFYMKK